MSVYCNTNEYLLALITNKLGNRITVLEDMKQPECNKQITFLRHKLLVTEEQIKQFKEEKIKQMEDAITKKKLFDSEEKNKQKEYAITRKKFFDSLEDIRKVIFEHPCRKEFPLYQTECNPGCLHVLDDNEYYSELNTIALKNNTNEYFIALKGITNHFKYYIPFLTEFVKNKFSQHMSESSCRIMLEDKSTFLHQTLSDVIKQIEEEKIKQTEYAITKKKLFDDLEVDEKIKQTEDAITKKKLFDTLFDVEEQIKQTEDAITKKKSFEADEKIKQMEDAITKTYHLTLWSLVLGLGVLLLTALPLLATVNWHNIVALAKRALECLLTY
jgi:hypothetical protein